MSKHRKAGRGPTPIPGLGERFHRSHRKSGNPLRSKVAAGVVAAGAFGAVGQPLAANAGAEDHLGSAQPLALRDDFSESVSGMSGPPSQVRLLQPETGAGLQDEARKLDKSKSIEQTRVAAEQAEQQAKEAEAAAQRKTAEEAAARKAKFVKPAEGTYTSGFGARWGTSHYGVDIANSIGTPIRAVAAGEVIDAGPASGFGQWIRLRHNDGTITVYGHINTIDVNLGDQVKAGEQIATMGARGQATGPHLHFEVIENGTKIDPEPWLQQRGISL